MINLNFGLFWCGGKISYLRYLTFKTLRHFHPDAKIDFVISKNYNKDVHKWSVERQDFERNNDIIDYKDKIRDLNVNIKEIDYFIDASYCPVYQADLFRWWYLYNYGGFYLDTDQLILKSFNNLPLEHDFIYSQFANDDRPKYAPTGVLGCVKESEFAKIMMNVVPRSYSSSSYNSSGPFILEFVLGRMTLNNSYNADPILFYPIKCSKYVSKIYNGEFEIPKESICLHWYGAHPMSQEFNNNYTEEFAVKSNDTISRILRDL